MAFAEGANIRRMQTDSSDDPFAGRISRIFTPDERTDVRVRQKRFYWWIAGAILCSMVARHAILLGNA